MVTIDDIKKLVVTLWAGITAYLHPISGEVTSLVLLFMLNFLFGLFSGLLASKESFSFKKAFRCIFEAMVFFMLVSAIYSIGDHKGNQEGALQCVSFVSYTIIYFYGVNILRNAKLIFPEHSVAYKVAAFLYYVLSVEFIKHIPYLTNYLKEKKSNDQSIS